MKKFEGTPGPWVVNTSYNWIESDIADKVVIGGARLPNKEDLALIAAAPELLEALQAVMTMFPVIEDDGTGRTGFTTETIQKLHNARTAIAKALGKTK